jgi:NAD(P) transhydrogenase subunit alpha
VLGVGLIAPASFMQHFIVFVLSVFIGFQVIWNVAHSAAHAADGGHQRDLVDHHSGRADPDRIDLVLITLLAALGIFMAAINIFGGFLVTRRMLAMFQKS